MNTGAKVAVGCAIAVVGAGIVAAVALGGAVFWARGKVQDAVGGLQETTTAIETYEKQANAYPFTEPTDGLLKEERLVKYLNVRRQVHAVYEKYRPQLEAMAKQHENHRDPSLSDLGTMVTMLPKLIGEFRLTTLQGLAAEGMSEGEYQWTTRLLYQTAAFAGPASDRSGKQVGDAVAESLGQMRESLRQGMEQAAKAAERAGGTPGTTPSSADMEQLDKAIKEIGDRTSGLNVAPENAALFKKYKADIEKYTMNSLAFLGL